MKPAVSERAKAMDPGVVNPLDSVQLWEIIWEKTR